MRQTDCTGRRRRRRPRQAGGRKPHVGDAATRAHHAPRRRGGRMRRISVLLPLPPNIMAGFFVELRQLGFVEGENLIVDRRGFSARYEQYPVLAADRKSTRLNSSHDQISYAVFCLKKKKTGRARASSLSTTASGR